MNFRDQGIIIAKNAFKENSYVQIVAKLKQPWVPIFLSLVMVMLVFHTLLGVKAIVRDYLQEKWANYVLITMQIVTVSLMAISLLSLTNIVMEP